MSKVLRPESHEKGWGRELWISNTEKYCGKLLILQPQKKCSLHYHVKKHETFCIIKGLVEMLLIEKDGKRKILNMKAGDVLEVPPGLAHQFTGSGEQTALIMEVSTQHFEDDSYRIIKGD